GPCLPEWALAWPSWLSFPRKDAVQENALRKAWVCRFPSSTGFSPCRVGPAFSRLLLRAQHAIRYPCDLHHFFDVVHAHDMSAIQDACGNACRCTPDALFSK